LTACELHDHLTGQCERLTPAVPENGHGGGDAGVMHDFVQAVQTGGRSVLTSAEESLTSHLLAFAAEEARQTHQVIDTVDYWRRVGV
jgi:hypothetical protein